MNRRYKQNEETNRPQINQNPNNQNPNSLSPKETENKRKHSREINRNSKHMKTDPDKRHTWKNRSCAKAPGPPAHVTTTAIVASPGKTRMDRARTEPAEEGPREFGTQTSANTGRGRPQPRNRNRG
ncbi:hypothetical protein METBIDRAFT_32481 [Metschnikowia bicuspidata var. bicuspidata NRRL YB-4993]|uniref:Uncharacterized protein n=1 Tax=Metschnikowia bicuspidata var. bicuspidata NRRL YB-4993 TaxID=869754 RepID=A0A1A0H901_9ASCO|nr:hypothetical protein METBIDRAFT_32481 [Metschnikowia bicuspidata var. bicuspidata NRRL YB-4993]OBA20480.1 hypothetical protein METBIDRAFT_32481 [Metschnikowia bicuspidata var. bicuspidata NRRL YB-4993]